MKITLLGLVAPYKGGIAHFNTLLLEHLKKTNKVDLISWKRRFPQLIYPGKDQIEKEKKYLVKKDPHFFLDFLNPFSWLKAFFKIKKTQPELLILDWTTPALAPVFWVILALVKSFTKTKSLLICHNVLPHEKRFVDLFLTRPVFKKADYFLVHSREDLADLKRIKKAPRAVLAFHPTYASFKDKQINLDLKKQLNLKKKVLLFFGFIREYKGLKYLIKAMPLVLKKIDCDLLVVGEFWEDKKVYLDLIKKLGLQKNIKLVSEYVPDEAVANYFSAADLVVLPYLSATQSGIVQLAFGLDLPVITTNVGGLPDTVKHDQTGFLVPPKNPAALAEAVIRFYRLNKKPCFIRNIKKEKARFSWEKYVGLINRLPVSKN